jgi:ABC-type antimicrobial peptide transport system permease subunit
MPTLYRAMAQEQTLGSTMTLAVRAQAGPPGGLARGLAAAMGRANPQASFSFRPMSEVMRSAMTQERLTAVLSTAFGALALGLATIGLYGVTSYSVNRRRAEIGIRIALGARPGGVIRLVLGRVGWLLAIGGATGALLSYWASRYIAASLLFGIEPRNAASVVTAVAALVTVGALAGWWPARRAAHVDPTEVLRES